MAISIPLVHYHVGVATRDLDEGMAVIGAALGLTWAAEESVSDVQAQALDGPLDWGLRRVVHSHGGPMRIELLEGTAASVWATAKPAELHHLAFWVDDVAAAARSLIADGWSIELTAPDANGDPQMFAYLTKPGNARIELTDAARRDTTLARLGWAEWQDYLR